MNMIMPPELFRVDDTVTTLAEVQQQLEPLRLNWQVREDGKGGKTAIAVLYRNPGSKEVWAVAVVEKSFTTRHQHNNPGGIYGEINFTLAGKLPDYTDTGVATAHVRGGILCHAGGTVHESVYADFWAGVYHQPLGSTPLPPKDNV